MSPYEEQRMNKRIFIGIDEVGRAAKRPASPKLQRGERASPNKIIIGIDEVGRGALAGPVVLAAVTLKGRVRWHHPRLGRIRDSKKLTPKMRELWFIYLTEHPSLQWKVTRVSPRIIDRINITQAANRGALRLWRRLSSTNNESTTNIRITNSHRIRKLETNSPFDDTSRCFVVLDGGLKLPPQIPHKAYIKGDERFPVVAAASIIAKVCRDRAMRRMSRRIPNYGFEIHKGYGTKAHYAALNKNGRSPIHRLSFMRAPAM